MVTTAVTRVRSFRIWNERDLSRKASRVTARDKAEMSIAFGPPYHTTDQMRLRSEDLSPRTEHHAAVRCPPEP